MNKKLRNIIIPTLFLAGSAATWMACEKGIPDPSDEVRNNTSTESAIPEDSTAVEEIENITLENVKLVYYNDGLMSYGWYSGARSKMYQMATFQMPEENIELLIPHPKVLVPNQRYKVIYEPFQSNQVFTAEDYLKRFVKESYSVDQDNYEFDKNLDGILIDLEVLQKK